MGDYFGGKSVAAIKRITSRSGHAQSLHRRIDQRLILQCPCETPRPLDPGISKQAKPTDYTIILMRESELDLRIEAKTVLDEREIKAEYLGLRGLKRFDDASNPYTISSYGGMVAYVVNHDAPTWSTKISTALLAEIGTDRAGSIELGARKHHISKHSVPVATREMTGNIEVNVVHFVLEVEASPSRRT